MTIRVDVYVLEQLFDVLVGAISKCAEQGRDRGLALAVYFDRQKVFIAGLKLHPCAPVRDQLGVAECTTAGWVNITCEVGARRADKLGNDNTFGTVNDERAVAGHHR